MTLLYKSVILCPNDLQPEDVEAPECGGAVRVLLQDVVYLNDRQLTLT